MLKRRQQILFADTTKQNTGKQYAGVCKNSSPKMLVKK